MKTHMYFLYLKISTVFLRAHPQRKIFCDLTGKKKPIILKLLCEYKILHIRAKEVCQFLKLYNKKDLKKNQYKTKFLNLVFHYKLHVSSVLMSDID